MKRFTAFILPLICTVVFVSVSMFTEGKVLAAKVKYVRARCGVNLRKSPSLKGKIIRTLKMSSKVSVIRSKKGWTKVKLAGGKKGYIKSLYLSHKKKTSRGGVTSRSADPDKIIDKAKDYLGVRYSSAGSSPSGFDCSGYIKYVFARFGFSFPHSAAAISGYGRVVQKSNLAKADLVFFSSGYGINHVGIYVGGGKMIHASSSRGIMISSIYDSYWGPRYAKARRVIK